MKICSRCGNNLTWNRSFCPLCGGFLVEKPDDAVSVHNMDHAPHAVRQEPAPTEPIVQPQGTLPPDVNPQDEMPDMPPLPSAEPPALVGSDDASEPLEQLDVAQAPQAAMPIYETTQMNAAPPVSPAPQPVYDFQRTDAEPVTPPAQSAPIMPDAGANEPEPVRQPKPVSAEPFLGIMKGSSSGRVEMIPRKEAPSAQPAPGGTFERFSAPEEIKAHSNVPNVDMFSRKRESVIPQPGIPSAEQQSGSRLAPGAAESQRVVGFTVPVKAPQDAGAPVQPAPPLPPTEEIHGLFPEAAEQPPVSSVPIETTIQAPIEPPRMTSPAVQPPAVPIMPMDTAVRPPAAQAMPVMPQIDVMPVPPIQPAEQPSVVQTHPTTTPFFGVTPPPVQTQPTREQLLGVTPPPPIPTPPIPLPLDITQAPPLGVTPPPTPTPLTPPLGVTPPPIPQQPAPRRQVLSQAPQQVLPPQVSQQALSQAPPQAPRPDLPQVSQPLPPQAPSLVQQPQVINQPAMSKFAELIPKSRQPEETAGQSPLPEPPKVAPPEAEKKGKESNFQPFQMGEFLKMFPEAKPD